MRARTSAAYSCAPPTLAVASVIVRTARIGSGAAGVAGEQAASTATSSVSSDGRRMRFMGKTVFLADGATGRDRPTPFDRLMTDRSVMYGSTRSAVKPRSGTASPWTIAPVGVDHYENFPVASLLCPPALRAPVRAIYAFARTADDIADEGDAAPSARLAELARFRAALVATVDRLGGGAQPRRRAWPGVFAPLAARHREHALPEPCCTICSMPSSRTCATRATPIATRCSTTAGARPTRSGACCCTCTASTTPTSLRQSDAICIAPAADQLLAGPERRPAARPQLPAAGRRGAPSAWTPAIRARWPTAPRSCARWCATWCAGRAR